MDTFLSKDSHASFIRRRMSWLGKQDKNGAFPSSQSTQGTAMYRAYSWRREQSVYTNKWRRRGGCQWGLGSGAAVAAWRGGLVVPVPRPSHGELSGHHRVLGASNICSSSKFVWEASLICHSPRAGCIKLLYLLTFHYHNWLHLLL